MLKTKYAANVIFFNVNLLKKRSIIFILEYFGKKDTPACPFSLALFYETDFFPTQKW